MSGAASTSFVYNTLGRRISKTINGVTTQYLYDGDNVAKEIKGGQNASVLAGGTDQIFSRTDAAGQRTMVADGLGSVLGLVDGAGNTTTSYTYDAFGGTTATGAASDNANQYTSRENDGTGLYFYRARYYSARFGRFVSEDPIRQAGSGINWYGYTNNDPINSTDATGLKSRKDGDDPPSCTGRGWAPSVQQMPGYRLISAPCKYAGRFITIFNEIADDISPVGIVGALVMGAGVGRASVALGVGGYAIVVFATLGALPAAYLELASADFAQAANRLEACERLGLGFEIRVPDFWFAFVNEVSVVCRDM